LYLVHGDLEGPQVGPRLPAEQRPSIRIGAPDRKVQRSCFAFQHPRSPEDGTKMMNFVRFEEI